MAPDYRSLYHPLPSLLEKLHGEYGQMGALSSVMAVLEPSRYSSELIDRMDAEDRILSFLKDDFPEITNQSLHIIRERHVCFAPSGIFADPDTYQFYSNLLSFSSTISLLPHLPPFASYRMTTIRLDTIFVPPCAISLAKILTKILDELSSCISRLLRLPQSFLDILPPSSPSYSALRTSLSLSTSLSVVAEQRGPSSISKRRVNSHIKLLSVLPSLFVSVCALLISLHTALYSVRTYRFDTARDEHLAIKKFNRVLTSVRAVCSLPSPRHCSSSFHMSFTH